MEPKELRIGSCLYYDNTIMQVRAIDPEKSFENNKCAVSFDNVVGGVLLGTVGRWLNKCQPVQLTPEILEKCGFITFNEGYIKKDGVGDAEYKMYIKKNETGYQWACNRAYVVRFKNLHELQNLHYSLTGEELTITSHLFTHE